ncbi:MAG: Ig-like domain-containing protein [Methanomassiliicoccaceae archaeon]|nr:Ig-like domain-containing protein [Methanomassiliicoccaceae archaeon]
MVKKSTKILSLVFAAALALVLLVGAPSDSSEGAGTAYIIDGSAGHTWANLPASLEDGDILTIMSAAGSPTGDTMINIAQDANVSIVGQGNKINNLRIGESATDTVAHTVTLDGINLETVHGEGYIHYKGVINLLQTNTINSNTDTCIWSPSDPVSFKGNGSLTATSTAQPAILAVGNVTLGETAKVSANGGAPAVKTIEVGGGFISMAPGTTLVLKNNNLADASYEYRASAAGNQWVLSGANFIGGSTSTDANANIQVASGATGTIKLASQPGITGPTAMSLVVGYSATTSGVFTLAGLPEPTVTKTSGNALITWDNAAKRLNIAAGLSAASYSVVLRADNGYTPAGTITFILTVEPATITSVTVSPASPSVVKGGTQQFTADVEGTGSYVSTVNWTVTGGGTGTSISTTGLLTVAEGETATSLTVTATSTMDSTKSGTATVTVTEPGGGGSNTMLYVAIIIVIVVVILVLVYFFVLKKKP